MNLVLNFRLELGLLYGQVTVRVTCGLVQGQMSVKVVFCGGAGIRPDYWGTSSVDSIDRRCLLQPTIIGDCATSSSGRTSLRARGVRAFADGQFPLLSNRVPRAPNLMAPSHSQIQTPRGPTVRR